MFKAHVDKRDQAYFLHARGDASETGTWGAAGIKGLVEGEADFDRFIDMAGG